MLKYSPCFTLFPTLPGVKVVKPKLAVSVIPVFRVRYEDLESYIQEVFGFKFDLFRILGCTHGMCPEYVVRGVVPDSVANQAKSLRMKRPMRNLAVILEVLATDRFIAPGRYIIDTHKRPSLTEQYRTLLTRTRSPISPECLRFKDAHKDDRVFFERATVLDQAMLEELKRGRR